MGFINRLKSSTYSIRDFCEALDHYQKLRLLTSMKKQL